MLNPIARKKKDLFPPFLLSSLFFFIQKTEIIMSEPLLNNSETRSSTDQDLGEDISLDNDWVQYEKRPSCMVKIITATISLSIYLLIK